MQGLKSRSSVINRFSVPQIRKKVSNSWAAVEDIFLSTKDTFERHKVVFTILTSIASVGTAWAGPQLKLHQKIATTYLYLYIKADNPVSQISKVLMDDTSASEINPISSQWIKLINY